MRLIAGDWRGRPILAPPGQVTRPTSDRAREALFSMLISRIGSFESLAVADLFAGSGALGLEALSRGAAQCLFIDSDADAVKTIRRNCETLGAEARVEIRQGAAERASPPPRPCDIIFIDPPYRSGLAEAALANVARECWLAPGGLVSLETAGGELAVPPTLLIEAERRFGKAHVRLFRLA